MAISLAPFKSTKLAVPFQRFDIDATGGRAVFYGPHEDHRVLDTSTFGDVRGGGGVFEQCFFVGLVALTRYC